MLPELFGETFGDARQRNPAGVGGNDCSRCAKLRHLLQQAALDFKIFGDGFDDPIAMPDVAKMIFEIAGRDQCAGGLREESVRLLFQNVLNAGRGSGIAVGLIRENEIEQ